MKKLLLTYCLLSCVHMASANESWSKSSTKDESDKQYNVYTLLSENKDDNGQQIALIVVSPKENIVSKLGFAYTDGNISCTNYCQYYVQFDNSASKYTFSIENKAIKLQDTQKDDFVINLQKSKEMTLTLDKKRFYFNLQPIMFKYVSPKDHQ